MVVELAAKGSGLGGASGAENRRGKAAFREPCCLLDAFHAPAEG